jgi:DNA repair protein RadC
MKDERATMRSLPRELRPYERAEALGEERLSDAELLAVLIRTGTRENTALDVAGKLLVGFGGLRGIGEASLERLSEVSGVGKVKAIAIRSAFELGKRAILESRMKKAQITRTEQVADLYMAEMRSSQEQFRVVLLDTRSRIIRDETVALGSSNRAIVDPKEVFRAAIAGKAETVILMHNHPTGDCSPSRDDYLMTKRLISAGKIIGIEVVDHLIFGDNVYYSFFDSGDMQRLEGTAELSERAG